MEIKEINPIEETNEMSTTHIRCLSVVPVELEELLKQIEEEEAAN